MTAYGVYTKYLYNDVLRAVVVKKSDADLLAAKWGAVVRPVKITVEQ